MRRASAISSDRLASERSSSFAATMVPSGVESSCAAPAASVASEASVSERAVSRRSSASSASRARVVAERRERARAIDRRQAVQQRLRALAPVLLRVEHVPEHRERRARVAAPPEHLLERPQHAEVIVLGDVRLRRRADERVGRVVEIVPRQSLTRPLAEVVEIVEHLPDSVLPGAYCVHARNKSTSGTEAAHAWMRGPKLHALPWQPDSAAMSESVR